MIRDLSVLSQAQDDEQQLLPTSNVSQEEVTSHSSMTSDTESRQRSREDTDREAE